MSATAPQPPKPGTPDLLTAWPKTAQGALAVLLAVNTLLIAIYSLGSLRWGARPTQLHREALTAERLDLNRADPVQLRQLPDVGEKLARRIDDYRRANGGFRSVDELQNVPGIGPARMDALRGLVMVREEAGSAPSLKPTVVRRVSFKKKASGQRRTRPKKGEGLTAPLNINRASAEELQKLPGIGPTLARRIIEARRKAPFATVDELRRRVRGIGVKTLKKLRPYVTVGGKSKSQV